MAETIGTIQVVATINTKDYEAGKKYIEKGNTELEKGADKTSKGFSAAWTGAIAGVAAALTTKFLGAITSSIDGAVKRVDTLANSGRTFENMGIDAVASAKAMDALEKSIKGLPTPLDSAVRGMTGLTATYGDIEKGQKVFSALNNAILGFGGTSAMVDNAIAQLSQLPMDGPLDAQTWNSLRNSGITPVLTAMAKDSGMSVSAMKEAFGTGELTVQDFTDRLLKMNAEGGGGLTSLEQIAKDSTSGIGTGFANMQTAITRGVAGIIEDIGSDNIVMAITGIGAAFTVALTGVSGFINFVQDNWDVVSSLAVAVVVATAAIVGYNTYIKLAAAYQAALNTVSVLYSVYTNAMSAGLGRAAAAQVAMNVAMSANPIGIIIIAIAALVAGLIYFFTQTETGKKIIETVFTAIKNIFTGLVDFVKKWGLTILAVIFWPFALVIGLIYLFKDEILAVFKAVWSGIKAVFEPVVKFYAGIFSGAWEAVKKVFSAVGGFFGGVWNTIVGIFGGIGTAVGNAIGGTFKNIVNSVLRTAVSMINGFIDAINTAVGVINNIPGVKIGSVARLPIPQLANGGIVPATPGGRLALIGEGGEDEAVIPLSKLDALDNDNRPQQAPTINVTIQARTIDSRNDLRDIALETINAYNEVLTSKGVRPLPT